MIDLLRTLGYAIGLFIVLPALAYLMSKLATLGYLKAKQTHEDQLNHDLENKEQAHGDE